MIHQQKCRNDFAKIFDFTERISENLSMITCIVSKTICKNFLSRTMNQDQRNKTKLSITKGPIGLAKCSVHMKTSLLPVIGWDFTGTYSRWAGRCHYTVIWCNTGPRFYGLVRINALDLVVFYTRPWVLRTRSHPDPTGTQTTLISKSSIQISTEQPTKHLNGENIENNQQLAHISRVRREETIWFKCNLCTYLKEAKKTLRSITA